MKFNKEFYEINVFTPQEFTVMDDRRELKGVLDKLAPVFLL